MALLDSVSYVTRKHGKRVRDENSMSVNAAVSKYAARNFSEMTVTGKVVMASLHSAADSISAERHSHKEENHKVQPSQEKQRPANPI